MNKVNLETSFSKNTLKFGFYVSLLTAVLTVGTFVVSVLTLPRSGPFCKANCFYYPFLDIIARFPADYLWMYAATVVAALYLVWMVCIHAYAPKEKRLFSQIALSFAVIASAILMIDYFLQISVIQPSLLNGEFDGISMLTQYNSHGVFIALEDLGYLLMSISFVSLVPLFAGKTKLEKSLRWTFLLAFALTLIAFILISAFYGIHREYRFEVASLSINWLTIIVGGILTSIFFRRELKKF